MGEWQKSETWRQRGSQFCVEVVHSTAPSDDDPHRWCVYAYLYPTHPHFAAFAGEDMWQAAAQALPLHGGPSFLRWHMGTDGRAVSVQVGADYHHYKDDHFTRCADPDEARGVFSDAADLVAWLSKEVPRG